MKVTTRLTLASVLLISLFLGVLVYDLAALRKLALLHDNLAAAELQTVTLSLQQQRRIGRLDDLTRKLFVTRDADYGEAILQLQAEFSADLQSLQQLQLAEPVARRVRTLTSNWGETPLHAITSEALEVEPGSDAEALLVKASTARLSELDGQLEEVIRAAQAAVNEASARAAQTSGNAWSLSWLVTLSGLALSLPLLGWAIFAIRRLLSDLREGTRSVAKGEFSFRLNPSDDTEFSRVAASFNEMARSLDQRQRQERDLLSHLSHELRTPLVAMQETNRALLDGLVGPVADKQRRLLELNLASGERLGTMIGKLLDQARLAEGEVHYDLQSHDVGSLARAVTDVYAARALKTGSRVALELPDPPATVYCDRETVMQVLANLLENALKFSPPESTVSVRAWCNSAQLRRAATTTLEVADEGPGVPDEQKEKIFERFQRLTSGDRSGIGLGLAICRQIVDAHGGRIWVEDNPGGGSRFCFTLPANAPEATTAAV